MRADLCLAALLCCSCSLIGPSDTEVFARAHEPTVIEPLESNLRADLRLAEPETSEIEEAPAADGSVASEAISVAEATRRRPMPYRNPRYIARCRRESRQNAPPVEAIEDKSEARRRARALARTGQLDELLLLSRIAYGETGTPQPGRNDDPLTPTWDEVEAFLAVLDGRRGAMSRVVMFVLYSPRRVFPHPGEGPRAITQQWIAELQLDGTRPPSWPRRTQNGERRGIRSGYPSWRTYGCPRWLATVDAVRRVLEAHPHRITPRADRRTGPCERQPDHWGGAVGLDERAVHLGWHLIDCGTTLNRFWVIPENFENDTLPVVFPVLEQPPDDDPPTDELREAALRAPEGILG